MADDTLTFNEEGTRRIIRAVKQVEASAAITERADYAKGVGRTRASGTSALFFKPVGSLTLSGAGTLSGGIYSGRICTPITSAINITSSTYSAGTIITDPGTSNSYAINLPEMGKTTHDLLSTTNSATLMLVIDKGQTATDGAPVYEGIMVFPGCS